MITMAGTSTKEKLAPTLVLFYDTFLSFFFMFAYWLVSSERAPSIAYLTNTADTKESPWLEGHNTALVGATIILVGSSMAFTFNMSVYYFVKLTSALTSTIGSLAVKMVVLLVSAVQAGVISLAFPVALDRAISLAGLTIVAIAVVCYGYFSHVEKQRELALEAAAEAGDSKALPVAKEVEVTSAGLRSAWKGFLSSEQQQQPAKLVSEATPLKTAA